MKRGAHQTELPRMRSTAALAALACAAAAVFGASSLAATSTLPGVSTGGFSHVHGTSALLSGRVNPRGLETTYFLHNGSWRKLASSDQSGTAVFGLQAMSDGQNPFGGQEVRAAFDNFRVTGRNPICAP